MNKNTSKHQKTANTETVNPRKRKLSRESETGDKKRKKDTTPETEVDFDESEMCVRTSTEAENTTDTDESTSDVECLFENVTKSSSHKYVNACEAALDLKCDGNFVSAAVLDEISLEGLDGITLEALWTRLCNATDLPLYLHKEMKSLVWEVIRRSREIEVYQLKTPRGQLTIHERFDDDGHICEPSEDYVDIYPYCPVSEKWTGTVGSCSTYRTRTNITNLARTYLLTEAETYANHLVVVASQKLRNLALLQPMCDPNLELTDMQFCILERVGRSRKLGEITQGKFSLKCISKDAKQLFYNRKTLQENRLVLKQGFMQRSRNDLNTYGSLFHLYRFLSDNKLKSQMLTESIVNYLKEKPDYRMEYLELRRAFGWDLSLVKLMKSHDFQHYVKTDVQYLYRELYPDAKEDEWKHKNLNREKRLRGLELIDPNLNIVANWYEPENNLDSSDEDEPDENSGGLALNRSILDQVYDHLFESASAGGSIIDIQTMTGVDFYTARAFLKALEKRNVLDTQKIDTYRQHVFKYYPRCLNNPQVLSNHALTVMRVIREKNVSKVAASAMESLLVPEETQTILQENVRRLHTPEFNVPVDLFRRIPKNVEHSTRSNQFKTYKLGKPAQIEGAMTPENETGRSEIVNDAKPAENLSYCKSLLIEALVNYPSAMEKLHAEDADDLSALSSTPKPAKRTRDLHLKEKFMYKKEKFMGPVPIQFCKYEDEDGIEIDIVASTEPTYRQPPGTQYKPSTKTVSVQFIKRANFIIDTLNQQRIVPTQSKLGTSIWTSESMEGNDVRIDRKSLERIYVTLIEEGFIRMLKLSMSSDDSHRTQSLICCMDIAPEDATLRATIQQFKLKYFLPQKKFVVDATPRKVVESSVDELRSLSAEKDTPSFRYSRSVGKVYGFTTKFLRMQALHELMFYVCYILPEIEAVPVHEVQEIFTKNGVEMSELSSLPTVFTREIGWKMFIPPVVEYDGWPKGWVLTCDVLLRLPLSIFVKLHNIRYVIPELKDYLKHPVKKHLLVKHLPLNIRSALLFKRIYLHDVYESQCRLCYLGLMQFSNLSSKDKEQTYIYVKQNAVLYDTTTSEPGYHQVKPKDYKKLHFHLQTLKDIENYWYQMWNICMHTPLGQRTVVTGTEIVIENVATKPVLVEALKPRMQHEVVENDVGYLPGDRLGAAGIDSALWPHLKRNWLCSKQQQQQSAVTQSKHGMTGLRKIKMDEVKLRPIKYKQVKKVVQSEGASKTTKIKSVKKQRPKMRGSRKKAIVRKVLQRKKLTTRQVYYDKIDRDILKRMKQLRADWSPVEDYILKLSKLCMTFLCPKPRQRSILYTTVRDVLHNIYPPSRNKTSRACQRRLLWLYKNCELAERNKAAADNLNKIHFLQKYFGELRKRVLDTPKKVSEQSLVAAYIYVMYYILNHEGDKDPILIRNMEGIVDYLTPQNSLRYYARTETKDAYYSDPQTVNDVYCDTAKAVIHSALGCETEISLAYQLLKIYRRFPEKVLVTALTSLREQQFISLKKASERRKVNKESLFSSSPFQFSCTYTFTQLTNYTTSSFLNAYEFFVQLPDYSRPQKYHAIKRGYDLGVSESTVIAQTTYTFDVPEEAIVLNPIVEDHSELIKQLALRYKCYRFNRNNQDLNPEDLNVPSPSLEEIMEGMMVKTDDKNRKIPYITDLSALLVNGLIPELDPLDEDTNWIDKLTSTHFILNPPEAHVRVTDGLDCLTEAVGEINVEEVVRLIENDFIVGDCQVMGSEDELTAFVASKRELGARVSELTAYFAHKNFLDELLHLEALNVIIQVGVVSVTYVYHEFKAPWTINTYVLNNKDREQNLEELVESSGKVIKIMPWVMANGSLNAAVLKNWLTVILSHCMKHPGITVSKLTRRFPYLRPIDIYKLLTYLQEMQCLKLVSYKIEATDIKSNRWKIQPSLATVLDSFEEMSVELSSVAGLKLGCFLHNFKPNVVR